MNTLRSLNLTALWVSSRSYAVPTHCEHANTFRYEIPLMYIVLLFLLVMPDSIAQTLMMCCRGPTAMTAYDLRHVLLLDVFQQHHSICFILFLLENAVLIF